MILVPMDNVLESTTLILGFVLAFLQRILGTPAMPNALEMDNVSLNAFLDRSVRKDTWNMDLQLVMIQVWVECPRTKNKKQNQATNEFYLPFFSSLHHSRSRTESTFQAYTVYEPISGLLSRKSEN